jgi:glutamine phosphoribosylpyrophosphate amidotransferase
MCGIFGVIGGSLADYQHLGGRNTERGNLGFGGLFVDQGGAREVFRYTEPFDPAKLPEHAAPIMLGHVRAPTAGQNHNISAIHPFETADLLLAHNGLLLNHTQFAAWNPNPATQVDSLVIIGGIQQGLNAGKAITDAIRDTVQVLDGQQACWLWDKREASLYLWRVMSPIYAGERDGLCFSSVKDERAATLLDEGAIYRLHRQSLERRGEFTYHNPYR